MFIGATYREWMFFGMGIVSVVCVLCWLFPDAWAIWLVRRRNGPVWLLPFGVLALLLGAGNLAVTLGWAISQALLQVQIQPWVWVLLLAGVIIVGLFFITRRFQRNP